MVTSFCGSSSSQNVRTFSQRNVVRGPRHDPWNDLPAPSMFAPLAGQLRLTHVLHATRLDPWTAAQIFPPCVLFPQLRDQPLLRTRLSSWTPRQRKEPRTATA